MLEFDGNNLLSRDPVTNWVVSLIRQVAIEDGYKASLSERTLYSVDELTTKLIEGETFSKRAVLNYIKEGGLEPLGFGPKRRKMYSVQQFEQLWISRALKEVPHGDQRPRTVISHTGGMERVLAQMRERRDS